MRPNLPRPDFSISEERFEKGPRQPRAPKKSNRPPFLITEIHIPDWKTSKVNKERFVDFCRTQIGINVKIRTSPYNWANVIFENLVDKELFMDYEDDVSREFGDIKILERY